MPPTRTRPAPLPRSPGALTGVAVLGLVALVVAVVGLVVDDQVITGAPAWLKPLKFAVSIAVYAGTLAWLLRHVAGHRRAVRLVAGVTAVSLAAELVLIAMQVVRGTTSHFNDDTPFDATVFSAMGGLISLVFLAAAVAAGLVWRGSTLPASLAMAVRGGLLVALLGMAEAGFMLANTSGGTVGGHTVGAPDGGPGLPITGWSTTDGDLRIGHFVGLHALQLLPLVAWSIRRRWPDLPERVLTRLVVVLTVGLAGVVVLLTWQALRGQSVVGPDALTLLVSGSWVLLVAAAGVRVLRPARSGARP